jgi:hypothetical protein
MVMPKARMRIAKKRYSSYRLSTLRDHHLRDGGRQRRPLVVELEVYGRLISVINEGQ